MVLSAQVNTVSVDKLEDALNSTAAVGSISAQLVSKSISGEGMATSFTWYLTIKLTGRQKRSF